MLLPKFREGVHCLFAPILIICIRAPQIVKKEIGGGASEDDLASKGICSQAW